MKQNTEISPLKKGMKAPILLALLMVAGLACSDLTTSTDMVFDPPSEGPATFGQVQERVFDVSCASSGCHGGTAWPDLSAGKAYDNIVGVESSQGIPLVAPGRPDSSYLYLKLLPDAEISGDRMPLGGPYLEPATLETVYAWIEKGAPRD
jgi:hypothetical protein